MGLHGWVGSILRVDLASGRIGFEATIRYAKDYVGGRGIAARIAWEEVPPGIDAFDPANHLIFMTGPLTGTLAPTSGRTVVCAVSPRVYPKPWYTRSTFGGFWGPELKYAGYDGVIVSGKAEVPVYLWVNDGRAELRPAEKLWGKGSYETQAILRKEHGEETQVACIGQAGESRVRFATIQHGLTNAAGQVGFGAVMGDKRLKAVAVKGTLGVKVADGRGFLEACRYAKSRAVLGWRVVYSEPDPSRVQCTHACTVACGSPMYTRIPAMKGGGFNTAAPLCNDCNWFGTPERGREVHYEADGLQVKGWPGWDTSAAVELSRLSEDLGLCTWMLQTLAPWITKVYDSGVKELAGHRLNPYDAEWWRDLMYMIARREGLGDILAEDLRRASDKLGLEKETAAFQMFAWGAPAHRDSRQNDYHPDPGYVVIALQWALATRDPFNSEHSYSFLQSFIEAYNAGKEPRMRRLSAKTYGVEGAFDRGVYKDKAEPVVFDGNRSCVKDSLLLCDWVFPRILGVFNSQREYDEAEEIGGDTSIESRLFSAATGVQVTERELDRVGERIYNLERAVSMRFGRCREVDETVIPHFRRPDKYDGTRLREDEFRKLMYHFYELRGWDRATGFPTKEKLRELGLGDVAEQLQREAYEFT